VIDSCQTNIEDCGHASHGHQEMPSIASQVRLQIILQKPEMEEDIPKKIEFQTPLRDAC